MRDNELKDAINLSIIVESNRGDAFDAFVSGFTNWWPSAYTWSQNVLEAIVIEPKVGGRCFEQGPHHFQCDWGRVIRFKPSELIAFTWQISAAREPQPDPEKASEVEVQFLKQESRGTLVTLSHRAFSRHGEHWEQYLEAMDSEKGWLWILEKYQGYIHALRSRT